MKNSIVRISALSFIAISLLTGCSTTAEKEVDAQTEVNEANKTLEIANEEYLAELDQFRSETAKTVAENDLSIAEFKTKIEHEKKEAKAEYKEKIEVLEKKNSDMKMKMEEYKADGKENWNKFKTEFKNDMDELGKAFKDFTVSNKK